MTELMLYVFTGVLPLIIAGVFVIIRLINKRYHAGYEAGYFEGYDDGYKMGRFAESADRECADERLPNILIHSERGEYRKEAIE